MRRVRARGSVLCVLCVWSSVEEESAGGVCVFYDVKPLCEREKSFFFLFFFSKKAPLKSARKWQSMGKGRSDFGATRRRTRARVNARRRVEFIKHHVINSNKQNVIKKSDIVQVFSP